MSEVVITSFICNGLSCDSCLFFVLMKIITVICIAFSPNDSMQDSGLWVVDSGHFEGPYLRGSMSPS